MSEFKGLKPTKNLPGTIIQQMWQILRAHEIRLNDITSHFNDADDADDTYDADESDEQEDLTPVEKHVSTLKGGKKKGKNVTLNIVEEN